MWDVYIPLSCPSTGCKPILPFNDQIEEAEVSQFSTWVSLCDREITYAACQQGEYACWHSDVEDELSVWKYMLIRHVLNRGCDRIKSNVRMGTLMDYEEVANAKRLKQARTAPTSRCAGMTETSPFCSEMGISLR
jgi:hypothetical protein